VGRSPRPQSGRQPARGAALDRLLSAGDPEIQQQYQHSGRTITDSRGLLLLRPPCDAADKPLAEQLRGRLTSHPSTDQHAMNSGGRSVRQPFSGSSPSRTQRQHRLRGCPRLHLHSVATSAAVRRDDDAQNACGAFVELRGCAAPAAGPPNATSRQRRRRPTRPLGRALATIAVAGPITAAGCPRGRW
jgi:hypothetical protein